LKIIREHSKIIPGVVETVEWLQKEGIKVGSTTGYFKEAAQVILEEAIKQGYKPEVILCPDDIAAMFKIPATRAGRPYPYMILANMLMTESFPPAVVKVDDAEVGIKEGLNAGVWTVGVSKTGALVGLNEEEIENMEKKNPEKLRTMIEVANNKLRRTGAHYVIETISELPHVIMNINSRLKSGEPP
jgi:phosphonoacetaldehyde hydrolase